MSDQRDLSIAGTVKAIMPTEQVSDSFAKRVVVVTTDEQYPQHVSIEFTQDKCDLLDNINIGEKVNVGINIRGREWVSPQGETKYFNTIQGWKIAKSKPADAQAPSQQANQPAKANASAAVDLGNPPQASVYDASLGF